MNRKILIFAAILASAIVVAFALIKSSYANETSEKIKVEQNAKEAITKITDNKDSLLPQNKTFVLPKMETNPFIQNQNIADNKEEAIKKSAKVEADEPQVPDITNYEAKKQEDSVKQIAKRQRPQDMIVFLKEKAKEFDFNGKDKSFKFDLKEYIVGDKFLDFFEVTDIDKNFIRFKDNDYEYNLRFIKE